MPRIGLINYVNALPLTSHLLENPPEGYTFVESEPKHLNELIKKNALEASLMSSYAYLKDQDHLDLIPGFGIAATQEVKSVKLYHRGSLDRTLIGITSQSASAANLLKILAKHHWNVNPEYEVFETITIPEVVNGRVYNAFLLIGDPCLRYPEIPGFSSIDLATAWYEMTGLPFTFGVIASRPGKLPKALPSHFEDSLSWAENNPSNYLQSAHRMLPHMNTQSLLNYFDTLHYRLDAKMQEGLALFAQLAL